MEVRFVEARFVELRFVEDFFAAVFFVAVLFVADFLAADFPVLVFRLAVLRADVLRAVFFVAVLREAEDFLAAVFRPAFLPADFFGTFSPSSLASESPMAMACFLDFTLPPEPLFNFPCLYSRITFSTFRPAPLEYFAMINFLKMQKNLYHFLKQMRENYYGMIFRPFMQNIFYGKR